MLTNVIILKHLRKLNFLCLMKGPLRQAKASIIL